MQRSPASTSSLGLMAQLARNAGVHRPGLCQADLDVDEDDVSGRAHHRVEVELRDLGNLDGELAQRHQEALEVVRAARGPPRYPSSIGQVRSDRIARAASSWVNGGSKKARSSRMPVAMPPAATTTRGPNPGSRTTPSAISTPLTMGWTSTGTSSWLSSRPKARVAANDFSCGLEPDPDQPTICLVDDVPVRDLDSDREPEPLCQLGGLQGIPGEPADRHQAVGVQQLRDVFRGRPSGLLPRAEQAPDLARTGRAVGVVGGGLAARRSPPLGVVGCPTDGLDRMVDRVVDGHPRHIGAEAAEAATRTTGFVGRAAPARAVAETRGSAGATLAGTTTTSRMSTSGLSRRGSTTPERFSAAVPPAPRSIGLLVPVVLDTSPSSRARSWSGKLRDDEPLSVRSVGGKDAEATGVADDGDPSSHRQRLLGEEERGPAHRLGALDTV